MLAVNSGSVSLSKKEWDKVCQRTFDAVNSLILNSVLVQYHRAADCKGISHLAWIKELGSIHVKGPRQSGHTTVIKKLAQKRKDAVFVFINANIQRVFEDLCPSAKGRCTTIDSIDKLRGLHP